MSSSFSFYSESLELNLQTGPNYLILSFSPLTLLALTIAHQPSLRLSMFRRRAVLQMNYAL